MAEGNCQQHAAHDQRFETIEKTIDRYNDNQAEIIKDQLKTRERLTAAEQSTRSAHHRLDSQEEQTKAIFELAFEVRTVGNRQETIIEQQSQILEHLANHDERLGDLEMAPGKTAIKAWHWVAVTFGSAFVGMIFTILGALALGFFK